MNSTLTCLMDKSELAYRFVTQTNHSVFITGKAGTGKTTLLRRIVEDSRKNTVVTAPTGIAAINAGGVTLHSFFQLPFQTFIPDPMNTHRHREKGYNDPQTLFRQVHFSKFKIDLFRKIDTLIIDEVSMVSADVMDMIDTILKHCRQNSEPFGGLQVACFGDLLQLPPVVKNDEWSVMQHYYKSPFFFEAQVLQQNPFSIVELDTVYRQKEESFLQVLNRIRDNTCTREDLNYLNSFCQPGYKAKENSGQITLTTHNDKAENINQSHLKKIPEKAFTYHAKVQNDFPERLYPMDPVLNLKTGAQVMFTKNDRGDQRRFFNGMIAQVKALEEDKIIVVPQGADHELVVERETWRNIHYQYDKTNQQISEEESGSFTHFPLRLAWAITIHKSQGLTFEKAVIDAGESFASGQVYVALSRLTSTKEMVLSSRINPDSIRSDGRIGDYMRQSSSVEYLQNILQQEEKRYLSLSLSRHFEFSSLQEELVDIIEFAGEKKLPGDKESVELWREIKRECDALEMTAAKFRNQLNKLVATSTVESLNTLAERTQQASNYFIPEWEIKILGPVTEHLKKMSVKSRTKGYIKGVQPFAMMVRQTLQQLQQASVYAKGIAQNKEVSEVIKEANSVVKKYANTLEELPESKKAAKGDSHRMSLDMYLSGKTIAEIAEIRALAAGTIEGHLCTFIETGEVKVEDIVDAPTMQLIHATLDKIGFLSSKSVRDELNQTVSYNQVKVAMDVYKERNRLNTEN